jgi:putative polyhydroxyalkanoate system protein
MATIDLRRKHTMTRDQTRAKAEELARGMEEKLGIRWRWEGDSIRFDTPAGVAKGTSGQVDVSDAEVRVQIDLPFLLRAIKGMVEGKVKERLDVIVGPERS